MTDMLVATVCLVVLAPLLVLLAVLVRLDSPGPALFRQRRVGRGGAEFTLLKFRSMRWGTPDLPTDVMARQAVSPVTRAGLLLRRSSLDELPQLINVLRGEMSLIGPRPALPSQTFVNAGRRAAGVDRLRPGITGWAQVCGRDELTDTEKVTCDAYYRDNLSARLDCLILARTVAAVWTGRGNR